MKKIIVLLFSILAIIVNAQGLSKSEAIRQLKQIIANESSLYPVKGFAYTILQPEISNDKFISAMILDENYCSVEEFAQNLKDSKSAIGALKKNQMMARLLIASGCSYVNRTIGKESKKVVDVVYSPSELKAFMEEEVSDLDAIKQMVSNTKKAVPIDMGDDIWLTDIQLEGKTLTQRLKLNGDFLTIELLNDLLNEDREGTIAYLMNEWLIDDIVVQRQANAIINSGITIKKIYFSAKSNKTITIEVTPNMLREILK